MKPAPANWSRFASAVVYQDAAAAIDWLCRAFGFTVRIKVEDAQGRVAHSELCYGEGIIMVAQEAGSSSHGWSAAMRSPRSIGGACTQSVMFYADDVDAHCVHARSQGARILQEPTTQDYGADHWSDRAYAALDPEGHLWWISQRLRDPPLSK